MFVNRKVHKRNAILEKCSGNSVAARKHFWSLVSPSEKKSCDISCVQRGDSIIQDPEAISLEIQNHLKNVFHGSDTPVVPSNDDYVSIEHSYCSSNIEVTVCNDHNYALQSNPILPVSNGSCDINLDPQGWMDRPFSNKEVSNTVKKLSNCKAVGFDRIPNEFIKYSGNRFLNLVTLLFNKILESGNFPDGWNKGRITLVHKRGSRELLGNYRPLTVILSLSGLYSRLLNERLVQVVEKHKLLGEVQNGFRRGRSCTDNAFILDTILWKSKAKKKKVFLAFFDVSKAYDSVDRNILWQRMASLGFGGKFLDTIKSIYSGDSVQCETNGITTKPIYLRRGLRQGCSLSPMLFNLYISALGNALSISENGVRIGTVCISALFFADDLVVIASSREKLLELMMMVKTHADSLRLEINTDPSKSEVLAQEGIEGDSWNLLDDSGDIVLSLKQVMQYKYLGTDIFASMSKTAREKLKLCVAKAKQHKGSCIHISRDGPDVVDMVLATWNNIAIPSILFGCEMIPFTDTAIQEIERTQSQIAKYALGLPIYAANISAQIDLGMRPFKQVLYDLQLSYYIRVLDLDDARWVKQALLDHLSMSWSSPYLQYISQVRRELGIFSLPQNPSQLKGLLNSYFINETNDALAAMSLPWLKPISKYRKSRYVKEGERSEFVAGFKFNAVNIGQRFPRLGRAHKQRYCPLCPDMQENSLLHMTFFCPALEDTRKVATGLSSFRNMCKAKDFSDLKVFALFLNGLDWNEIPVEGAVYLERGDDLKTILDTFLSMW